MATQKFVLVGPHAGKTVMVSGHQFTEGEMTFHASHDVLMSLTQVLGFYGAIPAEHAELAQLKQKQAKEESKAEVAEAKPTAAEEKDAAAAKALAEALGDDSPAGEIDLAEALSTLDPNVEAHWTSNNLPSLDYLSTMVGSKVSRGDVEALAEGYTRAKARAAK